MKTNFPLFLLLFLLLASCQPNQGDPELARWESRAANVTIIRDDFGVPHVYGKTDADAVFGLLYAQCEDDFMRVERNYIWAIGRLAEVEGESSLYSDLRAQMFMTRAEAQQAYEESPDWLKALCDAFADGVNYYLHTHPEVQPALLTRFEPWMPFYFSEGSIGGDIERVSTRDMQAFYENMPVPTDPQLSYLQLIEEPQGSNGIAISGQLTESGNPLLLINPHTTFYFRPEVHMVSEEGLNAYGAVTWGQFFVYQGFNDKTGWMHTSSGTDVIDEFVEVVEEKEGALQYRYGEEWRPVATLEVQLKVREGDSLSEKSFPVYRTHHGPITHDEEGKWVATALMWEPSKALQQAFTRTKLKDHDGFREMMEMRTNSSNNTVYADASGNIAYYQGNFIPRRDTRFDYTQPVDGSDPATDWQGLHELEECLILLNPGNGWIQNCNSTPFTAAGEFSPKKEDYPYYMAPEEENFRGVHAIRLLEQQKDFTLEKLLTLAYDPALPAFEQIIPGLVAAFDAMPTAYPELGEAIDILRNWDFRTSVGSVPMTLAHYYTTRYLRDGEAPQGLSFMERVDYFGTGSPVKERLAIFSEVVKQLKEDFGTWNLPWGEVNRFQRLSNEWVPRFDDNAPSIPVGFASGNWGSLAAYGMRGSVQGNPKKIYGTRGNSFVAVVEFGEKVRAKSILAGGQSGDINSPHFNDQAQRYAEVNFKDVAYYREDVEKRAVKTYRPGERQ